MASVIQSNFRIRKHLGRVRKVIEVPNLIDIQKTSYDKFLQSTVPQNDRAEVGLQAVFRSVFPIKDFNGTSELVFVSYNLEKPKYDVEECRQRGMTFAAPIKVTTQLMIYDTREGGERIVRDIKEQEVYFGEIPLMTETGTFIINGTERVVVSQLHRSPGVFFDHDKGKTHSSGKVLYSARIIPYRGSWLDFEFDPKDIMFVRIDRRRKMHATVLLRALGYSTQDLLNYFYNTEEVFLEKGGKYAKSVEFDLLPGQRATRDIKVGTEVIVKKNTKFTKAAIKKLRDAQDRSPADRPRRARRQGRGARRRRQGDRRGRPRGERRGDRGEAREAPRGEHREFKILFIDGLNVGSYLRDTLLAEKVKTTEDAIMEIYRRLRPGDPPTLETAKTLFHNLFFNPERYDLSKVGRLKLNYKFYRDLPEDQRPALDTAVLTPQDILETVRHLIELKNGRGSVDDIDHLGNRRVRAVGELMENQYRIGLVRMERAIKERMSMSQEIDTLMPHDLINAKPVSAVVKEYFGSSQLSQFMDQTNPLSEVTHKRRLCALGPGGLTRERAGFEVRDVHPTHYGRICPIETPEGPNIGLIASLSTFARVNEYGFVETPYRRASEGRATDEVVLVLGARGRGQVHRPGVGLDGREGQVQGVARQRPLERRLPHGHAGHDPAPGRRAEPDGERRRGARAVPRARRREPRAHGREHAAAGRARSSAATRRSSARAWKASSRATRASARLARRDGIVESVDATRIVVRPDSDKPEIPDIYPLMKFQRSNQSTCYNQAPIVRAGERVKARRRPRGRPELRHGRARARPERARRVHAVAGLQLRGLDPRLRAHRQGRRLHLDSHRGVRVRRPRHEARQGRGHARHPERRRRGPEGPRRVGHRPHRRRGEAGRHPRRQDHAEGRDAALSRGEAAPRHLRREGRRRPRQQPPRPAGRRAASSSTRASSPARAPRRTSASKDIEDQERVRLEKMRDEEIKILRDSFYRQIKKQLVETTTTGKLVDDKGKVLLAEGRDARRARRSRRSRASTGASSRSRAPRRSRRRSRSSKRS